jgi:hypothetical protein
VNSTPTPRQRNHEVHLKLPKLHVHEDRSRELTAYGGLALLQQLARTVRFAEHIGAHVKVLKVHQGYGESDHLYHLLSALYAGASCVEDLGQLQEDEAYRRLAGADRVTDPSTMGDFLRRFGREDLNDLKAGIWGMRREAWRKLKRGKRGWASLDLDSKICAVYGEQKEGADFGYEGSYGYHPEMLSLAETGEWLDVVNRPCNEVSGEKAVYLLRRNLPQVQEAFRNVCVRGDTKFGRGDVLEECDRQGARVCLGWARTPKLVDIAESLPDKAWGVLERKQGKATKASRTRRKKRNLRRMKARRRGYTDKKLLREWVAEFAYHPIYKKKPMAKGYRMIVIRKQVEVAGKTGLFDVFSYRFILTDLVEPKLSKLVSYAYGRSDQENLIEQAKNGVSAFRMPTGQLLANEVWMTMAMLAHNFKSYLCLLALGQDKLGWEWKRFRFSFLYFVARVTKGARQLHLWLDPGHVYSKQVQRGLLALGAAVT